MALDSNSQDSFSKSSNVLATQRQCTLSGLLQLRATDTGLARSCFAAWRVAQRKAALKHGGVGGTGCPGSRGRASLLGRGKQDLQGSCSAPFWTLQLITVSAQRR